MVEENGNEHDLHSFALANAIYHSMRGKLDMVDRGVKRARFAVLRLAAVPSVLIEGGFLSNPGDASMIASREWRDSYAAAIARGILEYVRLAKHRIPPRMLADYRSGKPPAASAPPPTPASTGPVLRDLP